MAAETAVAAAVPDGTPGTNGSGSGAPSYATKRNHTKKLKKKLKKQQRSAGESAEDDAEPPTPTPPARATSSVPAGVEVEYVPSIDFDLNDPSNAELARVYQRFQEYATAANQAPLDEEEAAAQQLQQQANGERKGRTGGEDDDEEDDEDENDGEDGYVIGADGQRVSKKKLRKLQRMSVADLKRLASKPEVVEWVDVTAADPKLLIHLKSYRNTVPVPRHWSIKRKYLQNKRGMEKSAFELPEFIKQTGITEMRDALREKEETMKASQKARERIQPKMGKLEIDYQKLHDAFFRFQTKPVLSNHGEMYYEGKEFEVHMKERKPGQLSEELKVALGMPENAPPPWLINMQRYGPPPSYPGLRIPGLNAPIPPGADWGFHPGGWGRPPLDEFGNPLYGDVYSVTAPPPPSELTVPVETRPWGEFEEDEALSDREEEEAAPAAEDADKGEAAPKADIEDDRSSVRADTDGLATPSGYRSTTTSGLETPDQIELRKERRGEDTPSTVDERPLYTVLQPKETKVSGFMGSSYVYDFSSAKAGKPAGDNVQVALDPAEMETLDEATLRAKYEQTVNVAKSGGEASSDLSDMVAEHAAKADKKRKAAASKSSGAVADPKAKKQKEFKF